jgi:hypothetical protein
MQLMIEWKRERKKDIPQMHHLYYGWIQFDLDTTEKFKADDPNAVMN